jgi:hypothetical protein
MGEVFDVIDVDKSNTLSREELVEAVRKDPNLKMLL